MGIHSSNRTSKEGMGRAGDIPNKADTATHFNNQEGACTTNKANRCRCSRDIMQMVEGMEEEGEGCMEGGQGPERGYVRL